MTIIYAVRSSTELGRLALIVLAIMGTVSFVSILRKRNYFEIRDKRLLINDYFFRTRAIKLFEISRVEIESMPFIASTIYLKDGRVVKYWNHVANEKDVKDLLGRFNIPIE